MVLQAKDFIALPRQHTKPSASAAGLTASVSIDNDVCAGRIPASVAWLLSSPIAQWAKNQFVEINDMRSNATATMYQGEYAIALW